MRPETAEWVEIAEGDFRTASREAAVAEPNFRAACFHAQQCAEKYLKAVLTEHGIHFPKTHDLEVLLASVSRVATQASRLTNETKNLTDYAVVYRYPGDEIDSAEANQALTDCANIRGTARAVLGLEQ